MNNKDKDWVVEIIQLTLSNHSQNDHKLRKFDCPLCGHETMGVEVKDSDNMTEIFIPTISMDERKPRITCLVCGNTFQKSDKWEKI